MPNPLYQSQLTRREFRQRMGCGQLQAVLVPLAALEQHLEHLAMEHDWRSVVEVVERVARRLAPRVLIAPAIMAGISGHHLRHGGTISLRPATLLAVLFDVVGSLASAGWKTIVVVNGHGGNVETCRAAWDQLLREYPLNLRFLSYWDVLTADDARQLLRSGARLPEDLPGHAQEFETALALAAFPENVRWSVVSDQPDPTPATATAATGEAFWQLIEQRLSASVEGWIAEGPPPIPPFHP